MDIQLVGGGTPYIRTLYLDPVELMRSASGRGYLKMEPVLNLMRTAFQLFRKGFQAPVPVVDNLSPEGRIILQMCDLDPSTCHTIFVERLSKWPCLDLWHNHAEAIVYEVGGYSAEAAHEHKCTVNRSLVRELRDRSGLPDYLIG